MFAVKSILVVCVGNICRSPVGEAILNKLLDSDNGEINVSSAGLGALVGHKIDSTMSSAAKHRDLNFDKHRAQQINKDIIDTSDLILVMEAGHRIAIMKKFPEASGRIMLFSKWVGGMDIKDPYRLERDYHLAICNEIFDAADAWSTKLKAI